MRKHYTYLLLLLFALFICNSLYSQKSISKEIDLFNKAKNVFLYKNYDLSTDVFEKFISNFPSSSLLNEAKYYSFLSQVYSNKISNVDELENFINNNNILKYKLLSSSYGEYLFDLEIFEKAIKYLLSSKLNTYDILYKVGYSYYILGDHKKAENFLKKTRLSDYRSDANYYLGIISMEKNNYELAINYFKNVNQFMYEDAIKHYLILLLYNTGRYEKVIDLSKEIDENTLNLHHTYYIIGSAYFIMNNYVKSLYYYSLISEIDKNDYRSNFEIGYSLYKVDNTDSAINILEKNALYDNYYGQLSSYYLGEIFFIKENYNFSLNAFYNAYLKNFDSDYSLDALFQYSKINFKVNNNEESISSLITIKDSFPDYKNEEINYLISENYFKTTNYKRAIEFIESLDSIGPKLKNNYQKVTFKRGAELFNLGKFEEAIFFLKKSLNYNIDNILYLESLFWIGESFFINKKYNDAYKYYIKLLNCDCKIDSRIKLNTIYSIAYTLYNNKEYEKSIQYFRTYINLTDKKDNELLDAKLRLADSYYAVKKYNKSIEIYKNLLDSYDNIDYINYQIGLSYYGNNDIENSIKYLSKVVENHTSNLIDDAIYKIGSIYFEKTNFDSSIEYFSKIINEFNNSELLPYSYLRRATCFFNLKSYEQSEKDYVFLMENFTSKYIYNESILGIQKVVSLTENFSLLNKYLEKFKNLYPEDKNIESIEFEAIKNLYFSQNYDKIIPLSEKFINTYKESGYINDLTYILSESNFKLKNHQIAIEGFIKLIEINDKKYYNRSINRLAKIHFELESFNESLKYFRLLKNNASNIRELTDSYIGILSNHYYQNSYDSTIYYAKNLLREEKVSYNIRNKANLFIAKSYLATDQKNNAIDYLLSTINLVKDDSGAEAQYLLANLFYEQNQLNQSLETLYLLNENFSEFNYWRGKSYLLIAKIFIKSNEIFQAKSTLESLIDKTSYEEIKNEALDILNEKINKK